MSKYLILIILTTPIVLMGMLNTVVSYNLKRIGKKKLIFRLVLWLSALLIIVFLKPIYESLINQGLTDSDPLSLFDVVMITAIMLLLLISARAHSKIIHLEDKFNRLHRQLSINNTATTKKK